MFHRKTAGEFNARHLGKSFSYNYVQDLVKKYIEAGSVNSKKKSGNRVADELTEVEVVSHFVVKISNLVLYVAAETGLSVGSVQKVMKINTFFLNKKLISHQFNKYCYIIEDLSSVKRSQLINSNGVMVIFCKIFVSMMNFRSN